MDFVPLYFSVDSRKGFQVLVCYFFEKQCWFVILYGAQYAFFGIPWLLAAINPTLLFVNGELLSVVVNNYRSCRVERPDQQHSI